MIPRIYQLGFIRGTLSGFVKIPVCGQCTRTAAWRRPWDREYLCKLHFNRAFVKRVQRTINRYKLFDREDKIAVGISGGKDSVVLLDVLVEIERKYPAEIVAVTVDEGIAVYREDGLKYAEMAARRAGIEHHIYSFEDRFGATLDLTLEVMGKGRLGACSYCGIFRRKLLNEAGLKVGATKIATGHNADDEAQTVLMNLMRGDILKTLRSNPSPTRVLDGFVRRVKPLRWTTEQEIVLYAHLNELPYQEMPCPNAVEAQRGVVREVLTQMQEATPDAIFSILRSADSLFELGDAAAGSPLVTKLFPDQPGSCTQCGQPSVNPLCRACVVENSISEVLGKKTS